MDVDFDKEEFDDVDGIYHLGVYSSSPMYKKDPLLVGYAAGGHIKILEKAKKQKIPVVFASTSSVYCGQEPNHHEEMDVLITDYYTEARHMMERMSKLYAQLHDVNVIGLRLFAVYGEKEQSKDKFANLVTQFKWAIEKGEKPVVYGDGNQTRDFTYVGDIVDAFFLSMEYLKDKKGECHMINAGTGKSYTVNEMIDLLNQQLGTNIEKEHVVPNPIKNYVQHTRADVSKAEKIIGFKAKKSLKEGINELIKDTKKKKQKKIKIKIKKKC